MGAVLVVIGALIPLGTIPASAGLPGSYRNPVSPLDTPDPDVVRLGASYYAFSTGDGFDNIPVMTTTNLSSWPKKLLLDRDTSDALPCRSGSVQAGTCQLSNWGTRAPHNGAPWSPSMIEVGSEYYLFYAAWDPTVGHYCIGVAEGADPMGPYVDGSAGPVVCQPQLGGSIDPDIYRAPSGRYYLAWKNNDGYGSTVPATLWASPIDFSGGGAALVGPSSALLTQTQPWESTIEQPEMVLLGGRWMLFFSGGSWKTSGYAIAYAYCQGPAGPCVDPNVGPVFGSSGAAAGPGAASIFTDNTGTTWMAYAAWTAGAVGYPRGARSLRIDPLCLVGETPVILGPTTTPQPLDPTCPTRLPDGYRMAAADGGLFSFGDAGFDGSMGGRPLNSPVVGIAATPDGRGYWEVAADGGIFAFGDAGFYGSMGGSHLNSPIVGIAADPLGGGYWEVASDGGIFSFGSATFDGSMGGSRLHAPVVGIASTVDGGGYWEVASDGGIFSFGDAGFDGSMGGSRLNAPIVGITATLDGGGYWEVASDGGIFAFGDAGFDGSMGGSRLNAPIVGIERTAG